MATTLALSCIALHVAPGRVGLPRVAAPHQHACQRASFLRMESELAYRRRMAEQKDNSKSIEWNQAYALVEKCTPVLVLGRPVGPFNLTALDAAISNALDVGVEYEAIAEFDKVRIKLATDAGEAIELSPQAQAAAQAASAEMESWKQADLKRRAALMAFKELQNAMPTKAFGSYGRIKDEARLLRAIDAARKAGVDADTIATAEEAMRQVAAANVKPADVAPASPAPEDTDPQKVLWAAGIELEAASPMVVFGRVIGEADAPRLRAAIELARQSGVSGDTIEAAEKKLKLIEGLEK